MGSARRSPVMSLEVAGRYVKIAALSLFVVLLGTAGVLWFIGRGGPTALYVTANFDSGWFPLKSLNDDFPDELWESMRGPPGAKLHDEGEQDHWWGGVEGDYGDSLLVVGPEGISYASCDADKNSQYAGWMRVRLYLPHWLLFASAFALPPCMVGLGWVIRKEIRRRRIRRLRKGLCPRCEYDVRTCPSGRCPECGEPIAAQPTLVDERA